MSTLHFLHNDYSQLPQGKQSKFQGNRLTPQELIVRLVSVVLIGVGGKNLIFDQTPIVQVSAGSLVAGATTLVASSEKERNERLRKNELIRMQTNFFMVAPIDLRDALFMMLDWGKVNTNFGGHLQTIDVDTVDEERKETGSMFSPIKSAIASSPFGLGVKRFFFDRKDDQHSTKEIVDRLQEYEQISPISRELSEHLEHEETQYQLKALAKEACNYAMEHTDKEVCKSLNLREQNARYQFYTDVYFYLRVWLKNSIEYDMEMPDIGRSIKNVSIYLKAFEFLRSERVDYFLVPEEHLQSNPHELVKVISQYLDALIEKLESDQLGQGVFGRLLNPHH